MTGEEFKFKTIEFCILEDITYENLKHYYLNNLEKFVNLHCLREHWLVNEYDSCEMKKIKSVFIKFSKWFLEERGARYIINGQMINKK